MHGVSSDQLVPAQHLVHSFLEVVRKSTPVSLFLEECISIEVCDCESPPSLTFLFMFPFSSWSRQHSPAGVDHSYPLLPPSIEAVQSLTDQGCGTWRPQPSNS